MPSAAKKQLHLIRPKDLGATAHGGTLRVGRRKTARPFSPNAAIHVVLKSELAKGQRSLLHRRNRSKIESLLYQQAKNAGINLYRHANAGNHLHLLIRASSKIAFRKFIRGLSGLIARQVAQGEAGTRFWSQIPFSRLIHWGREFNALKAYLSKNTLEATGFGGGEVRIHARNGESVIVFGAPGFRPGKDNPREWEPPKIR